MPWKESYVVEAKEENLFELTARMIDELALWLPKRYFSLCGDGFFASMEGWDLPRTHVTSRIRHNVKIFDFPKKKKCKTSGAPCKKGNRLACPSKMRIKDWKTIDVDERGKTKSRKIFSKKFLWYHVLYGLFGLGASCMPMENRNSPSQLGMARRSIRRFRTLCWHSERSSGEIGFYPLPLPKPECVKISKPPLPLQQWPLDGVIMFESPLL